MYHAAAVLQEANTKQMPRGKSAIKTDLLNQFDAQHRNKSRGSLWLNYSVSLGKVAALVVFFISILLVQYFRQPQGQVVYKDIIKVDTIYQQVASATTSPSLVHDTVYQPVYITQKEKKRRPFKSTPIQLSPAEANLHVEGIENFESTINRTKNNSFEQDTLVKKIGFVTL